MGNTKSMKVPVGAIVVGERDREDLGDIDALAASVTAVGLLHPVVVTESLTLVAGGRRLAAVKRLNWPEVPVTVVDLTNVTDVLQAEADENIERKALTPYEAERARDRRAKVLAEDAAKRQANAIKERDERGRAVATSANLAEVDSPTEPVKPGPKPANRETRKAAATGTGYSGSTLDKASVVRKAAEDGVVTVTRGGKRVEVPVPEPVREEAQRQVEVLKKEGAKVDAAHKAVTEAIEKHLPSDPDDPHRKWRKNFLAAISQGRKPLQFTVEDVAERADHECLDELRRFADDVMSYRNRVRIAVAKSTPDNVHPLRSVS